MAKLESNNLSLDVKFISIEGEWVNYEFKFYWKNEIIVNDNILKKSTEYWRKRSFGAFLANDYEEDNLIEIIKKVLDTGKCVCWEPMEPDVKFAIYPERYFPFMETRYNLFEEMEKMRKEKEGKEKSPEDLFTIITFIDSYNFDGSTAYSDEGISLHLIVERRDLEKFVSELETEYGGLKN